MKSTKRITNLSIAFDALEFANGNVAPWSCIYTSSIHAKDAAKFGIPASIVGHRKALWIAACKAQDTDPSSPFVVFAEDNAAAKEYNSFVLAISDAFELANKTQCSQLIYRATHRPEGSPVEYGVAATLPTFGKRIGDRIYPSN